MSRIDVVRGGITGARKTAIVLRGLGLRCDAHAGWGNLQVCGATRKIPAEYYSRRPVGAGRRLRCGRTRT